MAASWELATRGGMESRLDVPQAAFVARFGLREADFYQCGKEDAKQRFVSGYTQFQGANRPRGQVCEPSLSY